MLNFDAFELVDELPPRNTLTIWFCVDEWRGDRVRSRPGVRQFKAEGLRDDLFAGTPDTFFIKYLLAKAASCKDFGIFVIDIFCCIYARSNRRGNLCESIFRYQEFQNWRLKAAVNGMRKGSKHWQEYSSDKLVTNMLFPSNQNDINPCIYKMIL